MLIAGGLELVGEAANATDAIELVLDLRPDLVVIDIRLPGSSGVRAIERLGLLAPVSRVLVLTRSEGEPGRRSDPRRSQRLHPQERAAQSDHRRRQGNRRRRIRALPPDRRETLIADPRPRDPDHRQQPRGRQRHPRRGHRTRIRNLHQARQRQEQSRHRPRAVAQHQHRLQPHRQHPRQAPPREPRPSSRPISP
jgi:chemotaxis response regulator CheB